MSKTMTGIMTVGNAAVRPPGLRGTAATRPRCSADDTDTRRSQTSVPNGADEPMGGFTFPQKEQGNMAIDDPETDRDKARTALEGALDAAREGDTQKADAFTRIADAHIRMSTIVR